MTIGSHREVERKYDVAAADVLPALADLPQVGSVDRAVHLQLTATYFDTPTLALARVGITLRRRTGGDDDGWHLKLPAADDERIELRRPLGSDEEADAVPGELTDLVQGHLRGRPCAPVATLHTHRIVHRLRTVDGGLVAEVCDDTVTAHVHEQDGSVSTTGWREWEVEGTDIPKHLVSSLETAVLHSGARLARAPSKLARALGTRLPRSQHVVEREPSRNGPAAVVLLAHLRAQVREMLRRDPQVRLDQPDAVHKMRVATRRLRSALTTFKPMLDRDLANSLREELKWLADALGEARDAEVMRDRLAGFATDQPGELGSAAVADELEASMQQRYDEGLAHVREVLGSARYLRLLDALDALALAPPWTTLAGTSARKALPKRVNREWKRLKVRAKWAKKASTATDRDTALHEVRKAAKRLRYASEALTPVFGSSAAQGAAAAEDLQDTLGDHQDSVVSQQLIRDLAAHANPTGDNALIFGRLHLLEQTHAERTRAHYESALARVRDLRPKSWAKG